MSVLTAPTPLVAGQTVTLTPPQTAVQLAAVVVQNLSGLLLTVAIGGEQFQLAPYTQDIYRTSSGGQQVTLAASNQDSVPPGLPAYATATWYERRPREAASYPAGLSPPAYALGVAIAEQLLANGVPSVLTAQVIGSFVIPNGGQSPQIDVHAFATLIGTGAFTKSLSMGWADSNGTPQLIGDPNVIFSQGVEIPVALPFVYFINNTGAQVTLTLSGTNRPASHMFPAYYNRYSGEGLSMSTGLISPMVIGTKYDLFANFGTLFTGLGYLFFRTSNVAATGEWDAVTFDGAILPLADSAECVNLSVGEKGVYKLCALPPNIQKFTFTAEAGVNNNAKVSGCSAAAII